ncbi:hypothetical protein SAMN04488505_107152 [Chitinophaga rupis]|uniref:Uncharacterized protein n=1 Tax=Chitinophaga rupis TaxID=573321 RepID=A0A1H8CL07_9BACT|nr:hypothetical protein SAMN04488505_107152 [Chitinophaga rupis]
MFVILPRNKQSQNTRISQTKTKIRTNLLTHFPEIFIILLTAKLRRYEKNDPRR